MVSLLQQFEFIYPDGDLFYDRSGALGRRLREMFPGLVPKKAEFNQREFSVPAQNLHLLFGIAVSRLQSFGCEDKDFAERAASFVASVCDSFEIDTLNRFSFRHVLGRPCGTSGQAQELMWPLIGEEQKSKMASVAPLPS